MPGAVIICGMRTLSGYIWNINRIFYFNKRIAELAGVPLGTVQKIFSGATKAPREETINYIYQVLAPRPYGYAPDTVADSVYGASFVKEDNLALDYADEPGIKPAALGRIATFLKKCRLISNTGSSPGLRQMLLL